MSTLQERMAEVLTAAGLTVGDVAAFTGVSSSAVSQWKDGPTKSIKAGPASRLAAATGFNALWIATGEGPKRPTSDPSVAAAPLGMRPRSYPVISSVQAGEWSEIVDSFQPGDAEEWQDSPADLGPNGFILRLEGDSMTNPSGGKDHFPDGMYIHVHPGVEAQPGDYVVAKREQENRATFKKLVRVDGEFYLHAINPAWPKQYMKLEPGDRIVGKLKFAGWRF